MKSYYGKHYITFDGYSNDSRVYKGLWSSSLTPEIKDEFELSVYVKDMSFSSSEGKWFFIFFIFLFCNIHILIFIKTYSIIIIIIIMNYLFKF